MPDHSNDKYLNISRAGNFLMTTVPHKTMIILLNFSKLTTAIFSFSCDVRKVAILYHISFVP
jgi:hypothetical protein